MSGPPAEDYAALADADISDITSNEGNKEILMKLRADYPEFSLLRVCTPGLGYGLEYFVEDARGMGVLGHCVGRCTNVTTLDFRLANLLDGDTVKPLLEGLQSNRSIQRMHVQYSRIPRDFFQTLTPFITSNPNLLTLSLKGCNMDAEQFRSLVSALRGGGSLQYVHIGCTTEMHQYQREEQSVTDIADALTMHPHLEGLELSFFTMGMNSCVALLDRLQHLGGLKTLRLRDDGINDAGIEALVEGLPRCRALGCLDLSREQEHIGHSSSSTTTARWWRALASLLENPNCNLHSLHLEGNRIDDEIAILFANALKHNITLRWLNLGSDATITSDGWAAFSKVLCDTSSVNSTFLSNHTLRNLSVGGFGCPPGVSNLLALNRGDDKKAVAVRKILWQHDDFDMQPLFEWDLKVLPYVVEWLGRAAAYGSEFHAGNWIVGYQRRELSAIFQFVRGMPELTVDGILGRNKKSAKLGGEKRLHSAAFEG